MMNQEIKNPMHLWFIYLFEQRMDEDKNVICFECGKKMSETSWKKLTTCYSHILSKKIFKQYKGSEFNVKICHPDCHNLYTLNPQKAINQYNEYLRLLELHYENKLI